MSGANAAGSGHSFGLYNYAKVRTVICGNRFLHEVSADRPEDDGHHRLTAMRDLGYVRIQARIADPDECSAELIEISENLHRSDLSELDRSVMMGRWVILTMANLKITAGGTSTSSENSRNKDGKRKGDQHKPSGIREAARHMGITREKASYAVKIASLLPEAKKLAKHMRLQDNQAARLFLAFGRIVVRAYGQ